MSQKYYKTVGVPTREVVDGTTFNQQGVDLLCAAVLRYAYNDLLDAMFAYAAIENWKRSYNCYCYYKRINDGRKSRFSITRGGKAEADYAIRVMESWFLSERCKLFCKEAQGEWFIDQARRQINKWVQDLIPEWETRPTYAAEDQRTNIKREKRNTEKWKEARDAWRKDRGLKEIEG